MDITYYKLAGVLLEEFVTLEEFAERHNLKMIVKERSHIESPTRFYAYFDGAEFKDKSFLISMYGNGSNEQEAIYNYAREISGKLMVIGAYTDNRKEILVPIIKEKI